MKRLKGLIYLLSFFMTVNFTTPVFASFCQLEYGCDAAQITSLFAVYSLFVFLLEMPTGILSDRIGEKNSLMIGAASTAIAMFLFIHGTAALLYIGEIVFALGATFFSGPFDSIIYKYCQDEKNHLNFDDIISKSYALQWIALCFSFLGCYVISKNSHMKYAFWLTFIANAILLFVVALLPSIRTKDLNKNENKILQKQLTEVLSSQHLLTICLLNICFSIVLVTGYQFLQTYLLDSPIAERDHGLLYFIAAVFASLGSYRYKKWKGMFQSEKTLSGICLVLLSICMLGLGCASAGMPIFLLVCAYRLAWGVASPMFSSLINRNMDDDSVRNTVFSLVSLGSNLGSSILLFCASISHVSAKLAYCILGMLCFALFAGWMSLGRIFPPHEP